MRTFFAKALVTALAGIITTACTPISPSESFQTGKLHDINRLSVGITLNINDEMLQVRFDSVSEDSRCPEKVVCVWAGNARVHCTVIKNQSAKQQIILNTTTMPQSALYQGYTIRLSELTPLPTAGEKTPQSSYKAGLTITK